MLLTRQLLIPLALAPLVLAEPTESDPVAELAAHMQASADPLEQVELARLGRRRDRGGSLWWFEQEIRARLAAGEVAAAYRVATEALAHPLEDPDRGVLHELRALALASCGDHDRELGDLYLAGRLSNQPARAQALLHERLAHRLRERGDARAVAFALARCEAAPRDAATKLGLARTLDRVGAEFEAYEAFQRSSRLDSSVFELADWIRFGERSEQVEDWDTAFTAFSMAAELAPEGPFDARARTALERQAGAAGDLGYGEDPEPLPPPEQVDLARLERELEEWMSEFSGWMADFDEHYAPYWKLHAQYIEWTEALASDPNAVSEEQVATFRRDYEPWRESHDALASACRDRLHSLSERLRLCASESAPAGCEEVAAALEELYWENIGLEDLAVEELPSLLEAALRAARPPQGPTAQELAARGLALCEQGEVQAALVPLHLSLSATEDHELTGEVRHKLEELAAHGMELGASAGELLELGLTSEALSLAERAADLAPTEARLVALEGRCLEELGQARRALLCYRLAASLDPTRSEIGFEYARAALACREVEEARAAIDEVLRQDPRDVDALLFRAPILTLCGEPQRAAADRDFVEHLTGELHVPQLPWELYVGHRSSLEPTQAYGEARWSERPKRALSSRLLWRPGGRATEELEDRLYEVLCERADLETLGASLDGLSSSKAEAWPAVAAFLTGEVLLQRGENDAARPHLELALADEHLPLELAVLACQRLQVALPRSEDPLPSRWYLPLYVPLREATLEDALRRARPGQTIQLGAGAWFLDRHLNQSVRLRGAGAGITQISPTWKVPEELPRIDCGLRAKAGWIELVDLSLQLYGASESVPWKPEVERRFAVQRGALILEGCGLLNSASLAVEPGARLALFDCDLTGAEREVLVARGGSVLLDSVVCDQPLSLSGDARLSGDRVTLTGAAKLELDGSRVQAQLDSLMIHDTLSSSLVSRGGARMDLGTVIWGGHDEEPLGLVEAGGSIDVAALEILGRGTAGEGVQAASQRGGSFASLAHAAPPVRVTTSDELNAALRDGALHIELEPGEYNLSKLVVEDQLVLRGLAPGARLLLRTDGFSNMIGVAKGAQVELEGLELGLQSSREPDADDPLSGTGAAYLLDWRHESYSLLEVRGVAHLIDCDQSPAPHGGSATTRVLLAEVIGGELVSFGLEGGNQLMVRASGQAWLLDGGVDWLEIIGGSEAHLAGRGKLSRLEVAGASSRVQLEDVRPERLDLVSFEDGAPDPRSDLRRRSDGYDPAVLRDLALAEAQARWMADLSDSSSEDTWVHSLCSYARAHESALSHTVQSRAERARQAADAIMGYLVGHEERARAVVEELSSSRYGSPLWVEVFSRLPEDVRRRHRAHAIATNRLGPDASAADVELRAAWEEAILLGGVTEKALSCGLSWNMTPAEYEAELQRMAEAEAAAESEAAAAIASGDEARIREALTAISTERWLEYVLDAPNVSLETLREAERIGEDYYPMSSWIASRRREVERQQSYSTSTSYGSSTYASNLSTYTADWYDSAEYSAMKFNTWERDMSDAISTIRSSSYDSYRNSYSY